VLHPASTRIVICEIEPLIPRWLPPSSPAKTTTSSTTRASRIVYDDARHFILTTKEKFDIITSDPIHPWVKGAASLYTKQYFEQVRAHLNPGLAS
jgi:spermidine synthase